MTHASSDITFVDPATIVDQLSIKPGSTVADFGCGSGYFSFEFSRSVGGEGMVYALDVLPSALEAVSSRAKSLGLSNISPRRVNLENEQGSGLPGDSIDWVILKDMLFQNKKKSIILQEVARVLKTGGQALVMEWRPDEVLVGPEKSLRVHPEDLKTLLSEVGLSFEEELSVGGFHYAFLVKK